LAHRPSCTSGLPDEGRFARVVSKNSPSQNSPRIRGSAPATPPISGAPEPANASNASTKATTGVPNKYYRGPQQGSGSASRPLSSPRRLNKPKARPVRPRETPMATYRGPQQKLPGCPTSTTGVSNKNYRGARQKLPGCPTKTTGVSNKNYRGAQQVALSKIAAKRVFLCRVSGLLCFCLSCSVMLLNNNYRENGEVYPWRPIASS
jgi:hypothetical protein